MGSSSQGHTNAALTAAPAFPHAFACVLPDHREMRPKEKQQQGRSTILTHLTKWAASSLKCAPSWKIITYVFLLEGDTLQGCPLH